jgi:transposase-like protein
MSASNGKYPDTKVRPPTTRRRFTAAYKRKIVEEAAQCAHGEIGALLRREGLYSSYLTKWRAEYAAGTFGNKTRGSRVNLNAVQSLKPETLVRWHREGFNLFWRRKSKDQAHKPQISEETDGD